MSEGTTTLLLGAGSSLRNEQVLKLSSTSAFYRTWRFITIFTRVHQLFVLSQINQHHPILFL